jgi:hypothetical protein
MKPPIHAHKDELFCNQCQRYVSKHDGTFLLDEEVHCLACENWLCGFYDAFGHAISESPAITRVKEEALQKEDV